jgi:ferric-dicitrate binding protein FerR (iron transport regulator)
MDSSSSQRLRELFDRYLRRDLPSAEVEELVSLLGRADAEEALSGSMLRIWEELKSRPVEYAVDWDRMYKRVTAHDAGWRGGMWRVWGWRAAAAIFIGLAGWMAYLSVTYRRPVTAGAGAGGAVAVVKKDSAERVAELSWETVENKKVIHLPDGSVVILNKHSRLAYRSREVVLNGEAYFDIVHRPDQAFVVRTGKIVTRVLGTAFNIKAYAAEKSVEVTVDHGKVQVLKDGNSMGVLSDKQQMRFDAGAEVVHAEKVSLKTVMAWKPAEISFDDITMEEATRRIGGRFRVGFDFVNPALKDCRITATFYMEDDLDQIMTVICGVNQSRWVIEGSTVKIDGKGCN